MVGIISYFTFYNMLIIFSFYFITKIVSNFFYNTKKFFYNPKVNLNILVFNNVEIYYYLLIQLILIVSFKSVSTIWFDSFSIIFYFVFCFLLFSFFFINMTYNINYLVNESNLVANLTLWFYLALNSLLIIDNFINLLLLLEFISIIYFFFFLEQTSYEIRSFIKVKNMLNSYLWLSFFTLIFLFLSFFLICISVGTLNFKEILVLSTHISSGVWYFLFFGFFFKLGVSGFHILKFEVYKQLSPFYLILFSLYTFFFNSILIYILILNFYYIFVIYQQILLNFILTFNLLLLTGGIRSSNFYQFLAISTINTWSIMFLILSIN